MTAATLAPALDPATVEPAGWDEQHVLVACPRCATRPPGTLPAGDCRGLLYAWTGLVPLIVGERVLCPPMPQYPVDWATVVVSTSTMHVPWPGYIKHILRRLP